MVNKTLRRRRAFRVANLEALRQRLETAGVQIIAGNRFPRQERFFLRDRLGKLARIRLTLQRLTRSGRCGRQVKERHIRYLDGSQTCVKPFWPLECDACDGYASVEYRASRSRSVSSLIS